MTTQTEVVYPTTTSFSGSAALHEGPFYVPAVNTLLRAEVNGKINFQIVAFGTSSVEANYQLWALQWVPHGAPANDPITTADGPNWLIRQQTGAGETRFAWDQSSTNSEVSRTYPLVASWAGQLAINAGIDLYLSLRAPSGAAIDNMNLFASIRFWWR